MTIFDAPLSAFEELEQQAESLCQRAAVEQKIAAHIEANPHLSEMQAVMDLYDEGEFV